MVIYSEAEVKHELSDALVLKAEYPSILESNLHNTVYSFSFSIYKLNIV